MLVPGGKSVRPLPVVLTSGGGTGSRLALREISGMVSDRSVGEASEAGLVSAATFLPAFPLVVLFGVDMASGAGFGAVLCQEDLRAGGLSVGGSTLGTSTTGVVAASPGSSSGVGDFGGVVTV